MGNLNKMEDNCANQEEIDDNIEEQTFVNQVKTVNKNRQSTNSMIQDRSFLRITHQIDHPVFNQGHIVSKLSPAGSVHALSEIEPIKRGKTMHLQKHFTENSSNENSDIFSDLSEDQDYYFNDEKVQSQNYPAPQYDSDSSEEELQQPPPVNYKETFLQKYGVTLEIPSLYVQQSAWYPKDQRYFLQIVNYVVPQEEDYEVETHTIDKRPKDVSKFKELFAKKITGCTLRLIKIVDNLNSIKLIDQYVFNDPNMRIDKLNLNFSKDGRFLTIYSRNNEFIKVFQCHDIEEILQQIKNDNHIIKFRQNMNMVLENVFIDDQGKFMIINYSSMVVIYNIEDICNLKENYRPSTYLLPENFEYICQYHFVALDDKQYRCYIACKVRDQKQIRFVDIQHLIIPSQNIINFFQNLDRNFIINFQVIENILSTIFVNGQEKFAVQMDLQTNEIIQQVKLTQVGNKKINYIEKGQEGFYLFACDDFDEGLHIFKSSDIDFHCIIKRNVQPDIIKIFDVNCQNEKLQILSLNDDEFIIDQIIQKPRNLGIVSDIVLKKTEIEKKQNQFIKRKYVYSSVRAFSINWPYIAFSGLENFLIIANVFNPKLLHRVEIAPKDQTIQICETFITDTKDLFLVIKKENIFEILMLDLDKINPLETTIQENSFRFVKVLEYTSQEVNHKSLNSIFVRGSSRKETIQTNQQLLIFVLHEDQIFNWFGGYRGNGEQKLMMVNPNDTKITSEKIEVYDANTMYLSQITKRSLSQVSEIVKIEIGYRNFSKTIIVQEKSEQFEYIDFKIDRAQMMLIVILKPYGIVTTQAIYVKIFDLNKNKKVILECEIFDETLRGIFISGQYLIIDGHLYFKNSVIKIRYDLMKQYGFNFSNESIYFNHFHNILELFCGDTVKSSPLDSVQSHKLAFVILNNLEIAPKQLLLLPYLHERKIYLNRIKQNTKYFYTSVNEMIVAVNLTESKYYIYLEKGILKNRVDFVEFTRKYGEIVTTSVNGLNFGMWSKQKDTITIVRISEQSMVFIKSIPIKRSIVEFVNRNEIESLQDTEHWMFGKDVKQVFMLSNFCDLVVQISRTNSQESLYYFHASFKIDSRQEQEIDQSFLEECKYRKKKYYEIQRETLDEDDINLKGQNLLIKKKNKDFTIDAEKIYLWSQNKITYFYLCKSFKKENQKNVGFKISKNQKSAFIKKVDPGDEADSIAIVVEQMHCSLVLNWSMKDDIELAAFEVDKTHEIIWDHNGQFLILTDKQVTLPIENCNLSCFHITNFNTLNKTVQNPQLGFQNGYRFDSGNHNWIIMREYLCLSFSYMTFVIQSKFDHLEVNMSNVDSEPMLNKAFDKEAFTYILNKKSCFSGGSLVTKNHFKLQKVLAKLEEIGGLEILHYCYKEEDNRKEKENLSFMLRFTRKDSKNEENVKSALHLAVRNGNTKTVDTIMSYMAKININDSEDFKSVLNQLTDLTSFENYLSNLTSQTQNLQEKKVLHVAHPLNENIIAIESSHSAYIDDLFFKNKFGDQLNSDYKAYPVDVVSLKINWIISTPEGKEFLQAIHQSERLDFYEIRALQIIIEFLYKKCQVLILHYQLPLFLVQGVFFVATMLITENESDGNDQEESSIENITIFVVVVNQLLSFVMVCIMVKVLTLMGKKFLFRVYTWFDIIFYVLNTIANQYVLQKGNHSIKTQRTVQSFAILFFLAKSFYFMKLIDKIAPLVDIIIRVFVEIKWFLFVFFLSIGSFGVSFFLLGQNQIQFDNLSELELSRLSYDTPFKAWHFMWELTVKGGDTASFTYGNSSQSTYLIILNIAAQFILLIHLLNMLIAIMGDTFGKRNDVAEQIKIKDHLAFVMDNWYLKDFSLGDIQKIQYIICAFNTEDQNEDHEVLNRLESQVLNLRSKLGHEHHHLNELSSRQRIQELMITQVLRNQEMMIYK